MAATCASDVLVYSVPPTIKRRGLVGERAQRAVVLLQRQVGRIPRPGDLELADVVAIDLIERRILRAGVGPP